MLGNPPGVSVSPAQVIAPIGSEVVMIATVIGDQGYPLTREKIEWMIGPDGPGHIRQPGRASAAVDHQLPAPLAPKVTATYAINTHAHRHR